MQVTTDVSVYLSIYLLKKETSGNSPDILAVYKITHLWFSDSKCIKQKICLYYNDLSICCQCNVLVLWVLST